MSKLNEKDINVTTCLSPSFNWHIIELNLDETELTGFSFSFRDYVSDRVHQVCDRQLGFVSAAKQMSTRTVASQTRLLDLNNVAKQDLANTAALSHLQREAERSYEMIHDIINDLDRLDSMLPYNERLFANELHATREYPYLSRLMSLKRRNSPSLPLSAHSSTSLRRQIVSKKSGRPPVLGSRTISMGSSSGSGYHSRNSSTSSTSTSMSSQPAYNSSESVSRPRLGPYRLPGLSRHGSIMAGPGRCLRPRGSRGSMIVASSDGGSSANLSAPVSPISGRGSARSSFDGEALSENIDVNTLHDVMTGSKYAKSHTIAASQRRNVRSLRGSATKRPHSVISPFVDTGQSSYGRSDVSLSREQVIWSPQISLGSNESIFGYPNIDEQLATSTQSLSAGVDEGNDKRSDLVDNKSQDIQDPSNPSICYPSNIPGQGELNQESDNNINEKGQPLIVNTTRSPPILNVTLSTRHNNSHREVSLAAKTSPRSPTRRLSLQSGSSFDPSSPSTASLLSPITPIGSPSFQPNRNLNSTSPGKKQTVLSPQFPSEATRMLKRAIMDQQPQQQHNSVIRTRAETCNLPITNHSTAANLPPLPSTTHIHDNQESDEENSNNEDTDHDISSFPSEVAANQRKKSATTSSTSGGGGGGSGDYQERISTWSSSSTRTLADGLPTSRVSSFAGDSNVAAIADHPFPSSSALSTLNASAVLMKSGSLKRQDSNSSCGSTASNSNLGVLPTVSATSSTTVRATRPPVVDLGLNIRSDLERRVRSFSESAKKLGEDGYDRPQSSMGFQCKPMANEAVAGVPASIKSSFPWPARTTSISSTQIRNYSPHRASSLRGWRPEKPQPHRLSILNTASIMEDAPSDQPFTAPSDLNAGSSDGSKRRARTLECGSNQQQDKHE